MIRVKVVPGASRDEIVGEYGDRLRIRVRAPAEGGRANKAVLALLAAHLGVSPRALRIVRGHASPLKTVEVVDGGRAGAHGDERTP